MHNYFSSPLTITYTVCILHIRHNFDPHMYSRLWKQNMSNCNTKFSKQNIKTMNQLIWEFLACQMTIWRRLNIKCFLVLWTIWQSGILPVCRTINRKHSACKSGSGGMDDFIDLWADCLSPTRWGWARCWNESLCEVYTRFHTSNSHITTHDYYPQFLIQRIHRGYKRKDEGKQNSGKRRGQVNMFKKGNACCFCSGSFHSDNRETVTWLL